MFSLVSSKFVAMHKFHYTGSTLQKKLSSKQSQVKSNQTHLIIVTDNCSIHCLNIVTTFNKTSAGILESLTLSFSDFLDAENYKWFMYGPVLVSIGTVGIIGNILSIIVFTRPSMKSSALNCILIGKPKSTFILSYSSQVNNKSWINHLTFFSWSFFKWQQIGFFSL